MLRLPAHDLHLLANSARCAWPLVWLLALPIIALASAPGNTSSSVDTTRWLCHYCPAPQRGFNGQLWSALGSGGVVSPLTPLPWVDLGNQLQLWLTADYERTYADEFRLRFNAVQLGLDSSLLELYADQPGEYDVQLNYQTFHSLPERGGRTVFSADHADTLRLPTSWVPAGRTADMAELASSRKLTPQQDHRRLSLRFRVQPAHAWSIDMKYQRHARDGQRWSSGSFLTQSSYLPNPLDEFSDQITVSARRQAPHWGTEVRYLGSQFRNNLSAVRWQNPFHAMAAGAEFGQKASAPDNQSHQLTLSGYFLSGAKLALNTALSTAKQRQDAQLLPATINPHLLVALPRPSANAEVRLWHALFRLNYRPTRSLRFKLEYRGMDRDNQTLNSTFPIVQADLYADGLRHPNDDSLRTQVIKAEADYRVLRTGKWRLGWQQQHQERLDAQRERSQDDQIWTRLQLRAGSKAHLSAQLSNSRRTGSGFVITPEDALQENPLLRSFHLADRERTESTLRLQMRPWEGLQLGLQARYQDTDYTHTRIGLSESEQMRLSGDLSLILTDSWQFSGFVASAENSVAQNGSARFGLPDWHARSKDWQLDAGLSVTRTAVLPGIDLVLDSQYLNSRGRVQMYANTGPTAFPDLRSRWISTALKAVYHWRPQTELSLHYRWERYTEDDWQYDNLSADSLANVLSPGFENWNTSAHWISLSVRYRFTSQKDPSDKS